MSTKGKNEAQTLGEMLMDMQEAKERGLDPHRRGQSLYKVQSAQYQEGKLKDLLRLSIEELAEVAVKERIRLSDIAEVKKRTLIYLRACQASGTFPSTHGLARALGVSRRTLHYWRSTNPGSETGQWLDVFADLCADILSQSALKNNANPVLTIFLQKALYEMHETSEVILKPGTDENVEPEVDANAIRERYLLIDDTESNQ